MTKLDKVFEAQKFFCNFLNLPIIPISFVESKDDNTLAQLVTFFNKPKLIKIFNFDGRSEDSIITSLAHEILHQYQYKTGKLAQPFPGRFYWNGQENKQNYLSQPWEIEARQFAREKFIEFNRFWRETAMTRLGITS